MATSLSSLVNSLSDRLYSDKCIDCKYYLDYMSVKDDKLILRYFKCNMNYRKNFNKELSDRFSSAYKFCDQDINK